MTKEQLQEYRWIQKNIKALEDTLLELRSQAECRSPLLSDEPKGSNQSFDQIPSLVVLILETEKMLIEKIKEAHRLLDEIEKCIEGLEERSKYLLRLRYVQGKTWEEICVLMHYSWKQVHRIHSFLIKELKK